MVEFKSLKPGDLFLVIGLDHTQYILCVKLPYNQNAYNAISLGNSGDGHLKRGELFFLHSDTMVELSNLNNEPTVFNWSRDD